MAFECDFELPELPALRELPELPELHARSARAWRVQTHRAEPPSISASPLGVETVYSDVRVHAFSAGDAFRLVFDDTGTFDVRASDRTISFFPGCGARDEAVRADLLGRVAALAAHADGGLALHASAVSIGGRAVAFVGPKHAGKSTLALALVRRGARLIADDTLAVWCDGANPVLVAPGVQRVRLWQDSARALQFGPLVGARTGPTIDSKPTVPATPGTDATPGADLKPTLDPLSPDLLEHEAVPLAACYALQPVVADGGYGACVTRERLSSVQAAVTSVRFAKLGGLAGGSEGPVVLDRAARLAGATPFYAAMVGRDLSRLDDVAARLLDWHERALVPEAAVAP